MPLQFCASSEKVRQSNKKLSSICCWSTLISVKDHRLHIKRLQQESRPPACHLSHLHICGLSPSTWPNGTTNSIARPRVIILSQHSIRSNLLPSLQNLREFFNIMLVPITSGSFHTRHCVGCVTLPWKLATQTSIVVQCYIALDTCKGKLFKQAPHMLISFVSETITSSS